MSAATPVQELDERDAGGFALDRVRHANAVRRVTWCQTCTGHYTWAEQHGWRAYRLVGQDSSNAELLIAAEVGPLVLAQMRDDLGGAQDAMSPDTHGVGNPVDHERLVRTQYAGAAAC